jgi:hypothetical protein
MKQIYQPNLGVAATPGYCLAYVDDAGNAPNRRPSAKAAFEVEQAAGRIRGGDSPSGIWVVGFLEFTRGSYVYHGTTHFMRDLGHVFFMKNNGNGTYDLRDSEIASGVKKSRYNSVNDIVSWFGIYSPRYIGWSTNCDGRTYAEEEEDMAKTSLEHERILAWMSGQNGFFGSKNALVGEIDGDLNQNHVGTEALKSLTTWFHSPAMQKYIFETLPAMSKKTELADRLLEENAALKKQLAESRVADDFVEVTDKLFYKKK